VWVTVQASREGLVVRLARVQKGCVSARRLSQLSSPLTVDVMEAVRM